MRNHNRKTMCDNIWILYAFAYELITDFQLRVCNYAHHHQILLWRWFGSLANTKDLLCVILFIVLSPIFNVVRNGTNNCWIFFCGTSGKKIFYCLWFSLESWEYLIGLFSCKKRYYVFCVNVWNCSFIESWNIKLKLSSSVFVKVSALSLLFHAWDEIRWAYKFLSSVC